MYAAVFLVYLIRAAVILLVSLAVTAQFPVTCNGARRAGAFYSSGAAFYESFVWSKRIVN